ncbi:GNAT family N-acetyltransferase [Methanosarcina sp.]|uniref:GNAT family N-acetyltransferase n=1 Tax=Methanosarcina sp. TaxID=2213 RepID=UPI002988D4E1|nr:GNAT family N-acetyltransferase [Methanosarcina sp.]MDW5551630.1 GNAT family N-acetyltransferase [Methanosarcina sp.]MDW5555561.1 GNAT family N-acetyltransferase [Methanosarcina sp.]MDW5561089.1 GNAT family N-acetyltransferase [Methanosarcina sp.]
MSEPEMKLTEDKIKPVEDEVKSGLRIRAAEIEDVSLILEFVKGIARFENLSHLVTATEENLAEGIFGKRPYAEVFFAELGGVPAGFTVFFHNFSTFVGKPGLYIEDIFVKPEFRGKGIGKAMFLHCVKLAKERNCGRMEWAVLDWNSARKFYEHLGGSPVNEWNIYRMNEEKFENVLEK